MRGLIAGIQQSKPAGLVGDDVFGVGFAHDGLGAVHIQIALCLHVILRGLPGQLCAELEALDGAVAHDRAARLPVLRYGLFQSGERVVKLLNFDYGCIHQHDTVLFDIFGKSRGGFFGDVDKVVFQEGGELLHAGFKAEKALVAAKEGDVDVAFGMMIPPRAGAVEDHALGVALSGGGDGLKHGDGNAGAPGQGGVVGHGKASLLDLLDVPLH